MAADWPIVSLLAFRWMVLRGSILWDVAATRRAGLRRRPDATATVEKAWRW